MTGGAGDGWVESGAGARRPLLGLRELWHYRDLVGFLALRDLQVRYKQAAFGVAWAVIRPLVGAGVLVVLFHSLAHLSTSGTPSLPFTLAGFAGWTYFSTTVTAVTASLVVDAALLTKVYYPRLATPLAALAAGGIDLVVGVVTAEVAALAFGVGVGPALAVLPAMLVALVLVTFAVSLPLATLNVRYRDVGQVVGFVVQILLFLSPVAYASNVVPARWQWAYHLNPMVAVLDGLRWSLLATPAPGADALVSAAVTALLLLAGLRSFSRQERRFADVV